MNLRQKVTGRARELAELAPDLDLGGVCPHADRDPGVEGKAARAILIDRVVEVATTAEGIPTVKISTAQTPAETFAVLAGGQIKVRTDGAFDELLDACPGIAEVAYRHDLPDGSTGMKNRLGKFASIGVSDTAHMIRFAALNLPDEEPAELYKLLASS